VNSPPGLPPRPSRPRRARQLQPEVRQDPAPSQPRSLSSLYLSAFTCIGTTVGVVGSAFTYEATFATASRKSSSVSML